MVKGKKKRLVKKPRMSQPSWYKEFKDLREERIKNGFHKDTYDKDMKELENGVLPISKRTILSRKGAMRTVASSFKKITNRVNRTVGMASDKPALLTKRVSNGGVLEVLTPFDYTYSENLLNILNDIDKDDSDHIYTLYINGGYIEGTGRVLYNGIMSAVNTMMYVGKKSKYDGPKTWQSKLIIRSRFSPMDKSGLKRTMREIILHPEFDSMDTRVAYHSTLKINHPIFGDGWRVRLKGGISSEPKWKKTIEDKVKNRDVSSEYETGLPGFYSKHHAKKYFKVAQSLVRNGLYDKMINIPIAIFEFPNIKALRFWKMGKKIGITTASTAVLELSRASERMLYLKRLFNSPDNLMEIQSVLHKKYKGIPVDRPAPLDVVKYTKRLTEDLKENLKRNLVEIWEKTGYAPNPDEWGFHDFDFYGRVADYDAFSKVLFKKSAMNRINKIISRLDQMNLEANKLMEKLGRKK